MCKYIPTHTVIGRESSCRIYLIQHRAEAKFLSNTQTLRLQLKIGHNRGLLEGSGVPYLNNEVTTEVDQSLIIMIIDFNEEVSVKTGGKEPCKAVNTSIRMMFMVTAGVL